MKKSTLLLILSVCMVMCSYAQNIPAGMKYQAVARNVAGEVLPNRSITLKIELKSDPAKGSVVYYSEEHGVMTNQYGLFDLVVGMGKSNKGLFTAVPWSSEDIWMAVSLKEKDAAFSAVTESRLLAVPYAFHALTASAIANATTEGAANAGGNPGVPANVWSLKGNSNSVPGIDKLGTTDYKDLVLVTNNLERFRITADGDISINNSLKVGVNVEVGNDLIVKKNVFLNTVSGATTNNGAFTVANASPTSLTGILTVNKATTILDSLSVIRNTENFAAYINNTNEGPGDGLKIKLGKAKSIYSPPAIPDLISEAQMTKIKDLIRCDFPGSRIALLGDIVINGALEDIKVIGSIAVGTGNLIIDKINATLNLPLKIGPYSTPSIPPSGSFFNWSYDFPLGIGTVGFSIPAIPPVPVLPEVTVMPALPNIDLSGLGIPSIPITDLNFWGIPTDLCLNDLPGSTPLNNSNEFIRFTDKNDSKMGSIRAVSLTDWASNYLNPLFLYSLYGAITSSKVDKFHAQYHFKGELTKALKDYAKMGVEYTSGNGDYAEWLERVSPKELISAGDIVAVEGGRITRNLACAQQVMVVSHNPIVLGNTPKEGKVFLGNNIAFMGQVPVKVMGPVTSGDYIVGQQHTPGFGIAKHPDAMSAEDFKYAVGRSWDTDLSEGPKMVNTVVGVHNGDYLKIIKNLENKYSDTEKRLNESEARIKNIEAKVDVLIQAKPAVKEKKGF